MTAGCWSGRRARPGCPRPTISPRRMIATPVGQPLGLLHVVGGEEDRLAEVAEAADHLPGLAPRGGVEAGRGLVEEEQLRVADQGEADVEPALLAAREARDALVGLSASPTSSITRRPPAAPSSSRRRARAPRAPSGTAARCCPGGRCRRARATRGGLRRVDAQHLDLARVALAVALEDLDRRRLAGAVGPEESEDLAARRPRGRCRGRPPALRRPCAGRGRIWPGRSPGHVRKIPGFQEPGISRPARRRGA